MLYANPTSSTPSEAMAALTVEGIPHIDPDAGQSFQKDMSLTMTDFVRALPKAVQGVVTLTGKSILSFRVEGDAGTALIVCHPQANRQVGSLSLPQMRVEIELCDFSEAETEGFFNRFDLAFLRIGG